MSSLPGDHKTFVLEPTAAELEQDIPLKGGKGSNAKHFSLYHEIEFKYHERTGAFLGLNVREQFQFGPSKWFPVETLIQMKKIAKVQSWVPPVNVIRESAHGVGALAEKKNPKKGLGFFARSQTKAHILRDQLAPVVEQEEEDEDEVFMEQKGEDLECDHDSDYASDCDDEVSSECSDLDEEDDLPFICEECGQIFKTQLWFCRHMARGKHKKPAISMNDFVHKRMQLHIAQSKQVTSMHFQKMKVDSEGDYLPEQPALEGYEQTGVPFKQGWARKPKRQRGVPCRPEVKNFLRDCFLAAYDKFGKIDRARIVSKSKAHTLLKAKMETEGWGADYYRSVQQIGGHYSQFKKIMQLKSWKALKQQDYELEYDDGFPSDYDSDA